MLYTKLLLKTRKEPPADEICKSAQLLIQAGYIYKEMSGVYAYLPLGKRVLDKILQIIREEMEAIGGQELLMGSLQDPKVWQKTGRWNDEILDVWFKTKLKNETETGLATTHEEPLTKLVKQFIHSYKDLPKYLFQFQTKFRNELRSKSGILRTKEFVMKDLYSFNKDEETLDIFYEKAKQAYFNIFHRLGLGEITFLTFASGGAFSKYSHEFQTICEAGEDTIYLDRGKGLAVNEEVHTKEVLEDLGLDESKLEKVRAEEVGNIFKLKTRFSEPLELLYTDENGTQKPVVMGSYGIGIGRCLGTVVEVYSDKKGIIWPKNIAPFRAHLVGLNLEDPAVEEKAKKVYERLERENIEVLFDNRTDVGAGEKFADADLIGIPYRLVISRKTGDKIELKSRNENETTLKKVDEIIKEIK